MSVTWDQGIDRLVKSAVSSVSHYSVFQIMAIVIYLQDGAEEEEDDDLLQADEAKEEFVSLIPELGDWIDSGAAQF